MITKSCRQCGSEFSVYPSRIAKGHGHFCSTSCHHQSGASRYWKGGRRTDKLGYVMVWDPGHTMAQASGYLAEHRKVMAEAIGRDLAPGEVVHHINEVKSDNRIENLMLFESQAAHSRHHRQFQN